MPRSLLPNRDGFLFRDMAGWVLSRCWLHFRRHWFYLCGVTLPGNNSDPYNYDYQHNDHHYQYHDYYGCSHWRMLWYCWVLPGVFSRVLRNGRHVSGGRD